MNSGTGVFTSQDDGTWYFSFTGVVNLKSAKNYGLEIVKNNGRTLSLSYLRNWGQYYTGRESYVSIATSAVAELTRGDKISVRVRDKDGISYIWRANFIGIKL